jgi:hypothetical protein
VAVLHCGSPTITIWPSVGDAELVRPSGTAGAGGKPPTPTPARAALPLASADSDGDHVAARHTTALDQDDASPSLGAPPCAVRAERSEAHGQSIEAPAAAERQPARAEAGGVRSALGYSAVPDGTPGCRPEAAAAAATHEGGPAALSAGLRRPIRCDAAERPMSAQASACADPSSREGLDRGARTASDPLINPAGQPVAVGAAAAAAAATEEADASGQSRITFDHTAPALLESVLPQHRVGEGAPTGERARSLSGDRRASSGRFVPSGRPRSERCRRRLPRCPVACRGDRPPRAVPPRCTRAAFVARGTPRLPVVCRSDHVSPHVRTPCGLLHFVATAALGRAAGRSAVVPVAGPGLMWPRSWADVVGSWADVVGSWADVAQVPFLSSRRLG